MGVNAKISFNLAASLAGSNDLGSPVLTLTPVAEIDTFTPGTDAVGKADILFSDTRTLSASGTENLDLAGALSNAFGSTITAAEIVAIYIKAAAGNTNNVQVTRPASNGFIGPFIAAGDGLSVKPGEYISLVSQTGWAVTASTGDLLTVTNSGGGTSVTYDVIIIGRTIAA